MKAFVSSFYIASKEYKGNNSVKRRLNSTVKFHIELWRFVSLMLYIDSETFRLPLYHMCSNQQYVPNLIFRPDASTWKIGVTFRLPRDPSKVIFHSAYRLPFTGPDLDNDQLREQGIPTPAARDPSYHNAYEYLGQLFGALISIWLLSDDISRHETSKGSLIEEAQTSHCDRIPFLALVGDNEASLSWARSERTNSCAAYNANIADAWLRIHAQMTLVSCTHLAGTSMGGADNLSRNLPDVQGELKESIFIDPHEMFATRGVNIDELFMLFDPTAGQNQSKMHDAFLRIHNILQAFLPVLPTPCQHEINTILYRVK